MGICVWNVLAVDKLRRGVACRNNLFRMCLRRAHTLPVAGLGRGYTAVPKIVLLRSMIPPCIRRWDHRSTALAAVEVSDTVNRTCAQDGTVMNSLWNASA